MTVNKKIKNATSTKYDGIQFKSKLEVSVYKTLKDKGLDPLYECNKFILQRGFRPLKPYYIKGVCPKTVNGYAKIIQITYTPDFTVKYGNNVLFIEAKGRQNDTYPIKRKLFIKHLEDIPNAYFMEVYSKKDLIESLKQFDQYEQDKK